MRRTLPTAFQRGNKAFTTVSNKHIQERKGHLYSVCQNTKARYTTLLQTKTSTIFYIRNLLYIKLHYTYCKCQAP